MVKALPFIHQPNQVAQKASDVSVGYGQYQTRVKKYHIFSRVLLRLSSRLELLVEHGSLYGNRLLSWTSIC